MVGLIIRTYRARDVIDFDGLTTNRGTLPGSMDAKLTSAFRTTSAAAILRQLDIEWKVWVTRSRDPEIIFPMTEHQYVLWRIAGGDHWCLPGLDPQEIIPYFYEVGLALNSAVGSNLRPWKPYFVDGMAVWSRGDQHQIAIYSDGAIRGMRFASYINVMLPDNSCNISAQLARFPFAREIGL